MPRDVPRGTNDNVGTNVLGGGRDRTLNFGKEKMCKNRTGFGQLSNLTMNISGIDGDIENRKQAFSTTVPLALDKTFEEFWHTKNDG